MMDYNDSENRYAAYPADNNDPAYEDAEKKPRSKCYRCCCYCCLTRRGTICCSVFVIVLIAGIACAVYFLWPRIPNFQFQDIKYQDGTPISNTSNLQGRISNNNGVISLPLKLGISYVNDNYIPLYINDIIIDPKLDGNSAGESHLTSPINFPGRTSSSLDIPLTLSFNLNDPKSLNIQSLQTLMSKCNSDASKRQPIQLAYTATVIAPLISWTGYKPQFSGNKNFDCPWDASQILSLTGISLDQLANLIK
ncbi:hypothetical protein CONCODRAFT_79680 [Conidiobolus coronatus NRRL 28638]|uniref:Late embryogenesis abundant protein LEA-2 subgroup domain-containing protein n=1 Tax=Conidiobolus coronatus (strain ATCC 28846 / CBS 209.66 / NRRL 28638) TaxID=796925 RepID=A0A137P0P6_CONC2|nr:hypothetical protein CONCODRAFT_79680 [Conidiobolus coronatus NRRL 28638]|eukprot:KXN68626.1 hypothetical protein CONCODRAFT_79680 [Conidiobolus coronatus NRRL 28638]